MECVLQSIYYFVNCENIEDEDDIETLYWVLFLHFSESSTLKQNKEFNWSVTRSDDLLTLERGSLCLMKSRMMMVKMTMLMMELEMTTLDLRRTLDDCHPPWSHQDQIWPERRHQEQNCSRINLLISIDLRS